MKQDGVKEKEKMRVREKERKIKRDRKRENGREKRVSQVIIPRSLLKRICPAHHVHKSFSNTSVALETGQKL